ncbi:MAG: DUF2520 domain-containing protein [Gracilimonas sp.]|uniref:Rossmann-like and DUF2520 domain-containing protein n=1 Tax=Gracilimonas sp. TaxID=1974203 RepID=UPI0019A2E420|nr:Rossmann-like and DUF2520 domain-containing protein [Gracilimonas sp.]MBD3615684.1 DUF2520 domain-containing protein [Gracilimonas sp.]
MKNTRISIVGLGQVGMSFLNVLSVKKYEIVSVFNRSKIDSSIASKFPGTTFKAGLPSKKGAIGNLILLTVSDDAIEKVSRDIASHFDNLVGFMFAHCSGVHSSEVLSALKQKGAKIASFHPMKSITESANSFQDTWFDIEGDEEVLIELEQLTKKLQAKTFRVEPEAKPFLHAAAVVASNYLVVLADLVSKISSEGNVPEDIALKAMTPLMHNTLQNIETKGVAESLTGPIERGDIETIQKHLNNLQNTPELLSLYKVLGNEAVKIAVQKKGASPSLKKIKDLFS